MRTTARLLAVSALAGGLLASAPAAFAAINPVDTLVCLTESTADIAALADPANITVPPDVAPQACLAP
ncbi:hypothetical protein AB0K60_31290 [Thermopolyspora sp. NPDC052614]|uniref:hypothetical protein n=1 Tax=Thermopolyspora sp. NPDC052614 TaxID=3155682 RepID=UPI00342BD2CD